MTRRIYSETWPAPPRADSARPLIVERSVEGLDEVLLDGLHAIARSAQQLEAPFQRLVQIDRASGRLDVTMEGFHGVTGVQLLQALQKQHRLLPLAVWLAIADAWLAAVSRIPNENGPAWRTAWAPAQLGVDVGGVLTFTCDAPNHVMGHWPPPVRPDDVRVGAGLPLTVAPEMLTDGPVLEASRVHCLGAALIGLLTGEPPFGGHSDFDRLTRLREGKPSWTATRHPECPPALRKALDRAIFRSPQQRWPTVGAFREGLLEAAGVAPAPLDAVAGAFFGAAPDRYDEALHHLGVDRSLLPEAWDHGGLQVMEDRMLELRLPLDDFPVNRALPAAAAPAQPPRVNLAPRVPPPWWRRLLGG